MSKAIDRKKIFVAVSGILLFLLACWRTHFGLHADEVHSIAVGDMIARGNSFFKECWFYLQMSAVFNAPLIKIYSLMHGNLDGIILFLRIATVIVQMLIAILFYCTFYKEFGKTYAMLASFLLFIYVPDFQSFTYKQEIIWFSVLQIIFLYRYCKNGKIVDLILTGCVIALNVLAYPTACMMVLFAFTTIYLLNKQENRNNTLKHCAVIILTCAVCGIIYMGYVLHQIGIEGFITYFPKVFMDENLDSNFVSKLGHPVKKYIALGIMTLTPLIIVDKVKFVSKLVGRFRFPVITLLLWGAYGIQTYIERYGITWHCINYPYTLTVFIIIYIYIKNKTKDNRRIITTFGITTVGVILCMALASNQGNITSMYGTILSTMALVLMLGNSKDWKNAEHIVKEKKAIIFSLVVMGVFSYFIPVYEQESVELGRLEQRNIFTERVNVTYGPAKGLALGIDTYEDYDALCSIVIENVSDNDALFIIGDNKRTSCGYLCTMAEYATYSPQGGWGLATSKRAIEYYEANPHKQPTVVLVNNDYIGRTMDEYMKSTPVGKFLKENYDIVTEEKGYSVLRMKN